MKSVWFAGIYSADNALYRVCTRDKDAGRNRLYA